MILTELYFPSILQLLNTAYRILLQNRTSGTAKVMVSFPQRIKSCLQRTCFAGIQRFTLSLFIYRDIEIKTQRHKQKNYLLFPSFSNHSNSFAVFSPGKVLDFSCKRLILILQKVFLLCSIPDSQLSRDICHNKVECNSCCSSMTQSHDSATSQDTNFQLN